MRFLAAAVLSFVTPAFAGQITVNGKCTRKVKPDRASLNFEINVNSPKAAEAQKKTAAITAAVVKALKKLSFKDQELSTGNVSLNEDWDYGVNPRRLRGYHANTATMISTSEIDRIGEAIPAAMEAGAKSFGNLQVYLSDSLYEKSYQDCLGSALALAKAKAVKILGSEGKLELLELTEAGGYNPQPQPLYAGGMVAMAKSEADAAPAIEVKDSSVEASVTAKFKF